MRHALDPLRSILEADMPRLDAMRFILHAELPTHEAMRSALEPSSIIIDALRRGIDGVCGIHHELCARHEADSVVHDARNGEDDPGIA